jgi:hypothetical protein
MIRDNVTKALVSNDVAALNKYKIERDRLRRIEQLTQEMVEVKKILSTLCDRLDKVEGA